MEFTRSIFYQTPAVLIIIRYTHTHKHTQKTLFSDVQNSTITKFIFFISLLSIVGQILLKIKSSFLFLFLQEAQRFLISFFFFFPFLLLMKVPRRVVMLVECKCS